jgi:lysophospholipase L1-like esterase
MLSKTDESARKVIFFGDSITQAGVKPGGYIARLGDSLRKKGLKDKVELIGAGIDGNKVYDLYLRMEDDVLANNPDVVVVYVGVNDVWHKTTRGTGTDPDKFQQFYESVLTKLKHKNIAAIICTPAVIGEKTGLSNPQDEDLNQYAQIIRTIAGKNNLPLCDLRKAFLEYNEKYNPGNQQSGILTTDRVHLNDKGNQLVADLLLPMILQQTG